jgi:cytochrome b561
MQIKSSPHRYGTVAIAIHWASAGLIAALLVTGFAAANSAAAETKAALLSFHLPLGVIVLALTLFRLLWWLFADRHPQAASSLSPLQCRAAHFVHRAFYLVLLVMAASGIGMLVLSGVIPNGLDPATLPDFNLYPPRRLHGLMAFLLVGLIVLHVAAALYHHLVKRDGVMSRMWIG